MTEYNRALQDLVTENWDGLFFLMLRTEDDMLRKKIANLLHAFDSAKTNEEVFRYHQALITYIQHAQQSFILL